MYKSLDLIFTVPTHENIHLAKELSDRRQSFDLFRKSSNDLLGFDSLRMFENWWSIDNVISYLHDLQIEGDVRRVIEFTGKFLRCLYYANGRVQIYKDLNDKFLFACGHLANPFSLETQEKVNEAFYNALQKFYLESIDNHLYF